MTWLLFAHRYGTHGTTCVISFLSTAAQHATRGFTFAAARPRGETALHLLMSFSTIGTMRVSMSRVSAIIRTFLQALAVHFPVCLGSYFDFLISAAALETLPVWPGLEY